MSGWAFIPAIANCIGMKHAHPPGQAVPVIGCSPSNRNSFSQSQCVIRSININMKLTSESIVLCIIMFRNVNFTLKKKSLFYTTSNLDPVYVIFIHRRPYIHLNCNIHGETLWLVQFKLNIFFRRQMLLWHNSQKRSTCFSHVFLFAVP